MPTPPTPTPLSERPLDWLLAEHLSRARLDNLGPLIEIEAEIRRRVEKRPLNTVNLEPASPHTFVVGRRGENLGVVA